MTEIGPDRFDCRRVLLADCPDKILESMLKAVIQAYPRAYELSHGAYPHAQATELAPHLRRAEVHRALQRELEPYPDIQVQSEKHKLNNTHHLLIQGPRTLLRVAKVDTPEEMIPATTHPVRYAENNQLELFQPNDEPREDLSKRLFGVLLHGFFPDNPKYLGFLRIAFPNRDFTAYVGTPVDLMQRFPEHTTTISTPEPVDQEIIDKPPAPRLKRQTHEDAT